MLRTNVVVAATSPHLMAELISEAVGARADMVLCRQGVVPAAEADAILEQIPSSPQCAVVLVGPPWETAELAERWLAKRPNLLVLHVDIIDVIARITLRDPSLDSLVAALRGLVERAGADPQERMAHIRLRSPDAPLEATTDDGPRARPLLHAAIAWVHALLRDAVARVPDGNGDLHGLSVTRASLLQVLDAPPNERSVGATPDPPAAAEAALSRAFARTDPRTEPLAGAVGAFGLGLLEFQLIVLALAPELDHRFQRCIGFLLDEVGRRVGTLALYTALLGPTSQLRDELGRAGILGHWLVFESIAGRPPAADEPLRLDPFLARWLVGERDGLANDPSVRRALRLTPWSGGSILQRPQDRAAAVGLLGRLRGAGETRWTVLGGADPAGWRALLELGAESPILEPIRVEASRLAGLDILEIEECARRIGRMARLTNRPLVLDASDIPDAEETNDWLRVFLTTLDHTARHTAVICRDGARIGRLLDATGYDVADEPALSAEARVAAVRAAATGADAHLDDAEAEVIARRYPLPVDGLEQAMRLAHNRPVKPEDENPPLARFVAACKQVATKGVSQLVDLIEPIFELDDVVLPPDRKRQLVEIVDNVRFAAHVLDEWKFREQLPYGRGVTALFYGPSGTGKTMAALGIARRLGIQILRLDLSRIESKYIGDTPKNIDRAFRDAEQSGAAILIDEAEALLGKRSEVKDAHDRYANIEVAYLLQRMEAYEGLAILTTNFRQNLDPAFLRRLRFIVDFPRPDIEARERIWRHCLPTHTHVLDDAAFRHLARRIELTGGHLRQITLRAAFVAAAAGTQIGLEHIAHAAQAELAKLGMPPIDLGGARGKRAA